MKKIRPIQALNEKARAIQSLAEGEVPLFLTPVGKPTRAPPIRLATASRRRRIFMAVPETAGGLHRYLMV